jgi:hypothetical protein
LLFGNLDRAPERCFGLARVPEGGMCEQLALAVRTHGRGPMRCPDRSARRQVSLQFWRPVTAIRHGDIDDNAATERDAAWQPIDATPMHPEYPCAHCISSGSLAGVVEAVFGTAEMPEVAIESLTLPGVTHRWTNVRAYSDEVSEARMWAGFHYRFSTQVGQDMGRKIGEHVVQNLMQQVGVATR